MNALGSLNRVRHLNCGTFRARFGGPALVTHVLVCEFAHGVLLVDSGLGTEDVSNASARLGAGFRLLLPALDTEETALHQLARLGYSADDVRDIVLTHLDLDHAGGAADFPGATVHTTATELDAALTRTDLPARVRYRRPHLDAIQGRTTGYDSYSAELFGFAAHHIHDAIAVIPIPGHTAGHCAVAVRDPRRGWLLHAGDAFHHRRTLTRQRSGITIAAAESMFADDRDLLRANQRRLAALGNQVDSPQIFCAHDPVQFRAAAE